MTTSISPKLLRSFSHKFHKFAQIQHSAVLNLRGCHLVRGIPSGSPFGNYHPNILTSSISHNYSSDTRSSDALEMGSYSPPENIQHLMSLKFLEGKTALVTGSSRGIGFNIAKKLALAGANVIITGKTVEPTEKLPGTIFTAAEEVKRECVTLPDQKIAAMQLDVTSDDSIAKLGDQIEKQFGKVDICIHNSGALWWRNIDETPMKRFDLIMNVNVRGSFAVTQMLMSRKLMTQGHFVFMSPSVDEWKELVQGKAAYTVSKLGMSMVAHAIPLEYPNKYASFALWPKTLIESYATKNFKIGDKSQWRRADILGDSVLCMVNEPISNNDKNGEAFIDEDYLKGVGITDFTVYRCDPESEPPQMPFNKISRGKVEEQ